MPEEVDAPEELDEPEDVPPESEELVDSDELDPDVVVPSESEDSEAPVELDEPEVVPSSELEDPESDDPESDDPDVVLVVLVVSLVPVVSAALVLVSSAIPVVGSPGSMHVPLTHIRPGSQPPPSVHGHPSDPTAHGVRLPRSRSWRASALWSVVLARSTSRSPFR